MNKQDSQLVQKSVKKLLMVVSNFEHVFVYFIPLFKLLAK